MAGFGGVGGRDGPTHWPSHDGQSVVVAIDGASQDAPINGDVARASLTRQASGSHTYELIDPKGCVAPKKVVCQ